MNQTARHNVVTDSAESIPENLQHGWQHLPVAAIVTLYISGLQKFVRENLFLFFGAGTGFALSDWFGLRELLLVGGFLLLGGLLIAMIYHRRFQYQVDEQHIRVRSGFFEQKELKVPFERVQTTGMSQPIYMKPLGLTRFTLQTPGASITEVALPGMPSHEAEALRDQIARIHNRPGQGADANSRPDQAENDSAAVESTRQLYRASNWNLFLYGLTSNQIWLMLGFVIGPAVGYLNDFIEDYFEWMQGLALFQALSLYDSPFIILLVVLTLIGIVLAVLMVLSGVLAIVRYSGYQLASQHDGFRSRYGFFDQRENTLKRTKLHSVQLVQTAFGRLLEQWHIIGHQTGVSELASLAGKSQKFMIPGVRNDQVDQLARDLDNHCGTEPDWQVIDPLLQRVLSVRWSLLISGVALLIQWIPTDHSQRLDVISLVLLGLNLAVLWMINLRCKRWGFALMGDVLMIRSGMIGQTIMRFRLQSCQQVRVAQSPLQRKRSIATLHLRLPHGEVSIPWIRLNQASGLANLGLYHVENSALHAL